jgi:hypothetical protein
MELPSLRPELGYEVLKLIMLRESYIKRLDKLFLRSNGNVEMSILSVVDILRELTVQVVEGILEWEKAQVSYPTVAPYLWNQQNYLLKVINDLRSFNIYDSSIKEWFGFSFNFNPFLLPPELYFENVALSDNSFIVFGQVPAHSHSDKHLRRDKVPSSSLQSRRRSPYTTPIINDPAVFTHLSVQSKLNRKFRNVTMSSQDEDLQEQSHRSFLCYISAELLDRVRRCIKKLLSLDPLAFVALRPSSSSSILPITAPTTDDKCQPLELSASLSQYSRDRYQALDRRADAHRFAVLSLDPETSIDQEEPQAQQWSPHDVSLQKQVQRRGGELFAITVTATPGRLHIPTRQPRLRRLGDELIYLRTEMERNSMLCEDILSHMAINPSVAQSQPLCELLQRRRQVLILLNGRFRSLSEIHFNYLCVSAGKDMDSLAVLRERHRLQEGQVRPPDELAAVIFEESQVVKIQRCLRRKYGKVLRKIEMQRRTVAASYIQNKYRSYRTRRGIAHFMQKQRLARMLYRLYSVRKAAAMKEQLFREHQLRVAVLTIQRCFRGYLGRKSLDLKKQFVQSLQHASFLVDVNRLRPGDIEDLADVIEEYLSDYTTVLPIELLVVLRGILYVFNGNTSEFVVLSTSDGYTEKKYVYARTASWEATKLILRRKGRFLRRLRGFVRHSMPPDAQPIFLAPDAFTHLEAVYNNVSPDVFNPMTKGKQAASSLCIYLRSIYTAYKLQHLFPEYFTSSLPSWYRRLLRCKEEFDLAEIERKLENRIQYRLEECKRYQAREGKKYKHISHAIHRNLAALDQARTKYQRAKQKLRHYMEELSQSEQQQINTLTAIVRAKSLALDAAEGDYREYMKIALIPNEDYLREMLHNIDNKKISLLNAQADLIFKEGLFAKYVTYRDFERICDYSHIYEKVNLLGKAKADLYILLEAYKALVAEVGGFEYIADITGKVKERYEVIRSHSIELIAERRELEAQIKRDLNTQYQRLLQMVLNDDINFARQETAPAQTPGKGAGVRLNAPLKPGEVQRGASAPVTSSAEGTAVPKINNNRLHESWDKVSPLEHDFEEEENKICCKRDYEKEFRKKRKMESFTLRSPHPWTPCFLFLDAKLPRAFIHYLERALAYFNFVSYRNDRVLGNPRLQDELQGIIDGKHNVILHVNRSLHPIHSLPFDNFVLNLKQVLIPQPRCIFVSAEDCYLTGNWLDLSAFDQHAFLQMEREKREEEELKAGRKTVMRPLTSSSIAASHRSTIYAHRSLQTNQKSTDTPEEDNINTETRRLQHDLNSLNKPISFKQPSTNLSQPMSREMQKRNCDRNLYDLLGGKMRRISRYFRFLLSRRPANQAEEHGVGGMGGAGAPEVQMRAFSRCFQQDFQDFCLNIKVVARMARQGKGHLTALQSESADKKELYWIDICIAVNLCILFDLWTLSFATLSEKDICRCVLAFRDFLGRTDLTAFSQAMENFPKSLSNNFSENAQRTALFVDQQLECNTQGELSRAWCAIRSLDLYAHPARKLLISFIDVAREYVRL